MAGPLERAGESIYRKMQHFVSIMPKSKPRPRPTPPSKTPSTSERISGTANEQLKFLAPRGPEPAPLVGIGNHQSHASSQHADSEKETASSAAREIVNDAMSGLGSSSVDKLGRKVKAAKGNGRAKPASLVEETLLGRSPDKPFIGRFPHKEKRYIEEGSVSQLGGSRRRREKEESVGGDKPEGMSFGMKAKVGAFFTAWKALAFVTDEYEKQNKLKEVDRTDSDKAAGVMKSEVVEALAVEQQESERVLTTEGMTNEDASLIAMKMERIEVAERYKQIESQLNKDREQTHSISLKIEKKLAALEVQKLKEEHEVIFYTMQLEALRKKLVELTAEGGEHTERQELEKHISSQVEVISAAEKSIGELNENMGVLKKEKSEIDQLGRTWRDKLTDFREERRTSLKVLDDRISKQERSIKEWNDLKEFFKHASRDLAHFSQSGKILNPKFQAFYDYLMKNKYVQKVLGKTLGLEPQDILKLTLTILMSVMNNYDLNRMVHEKDLIQLTSKADLDALASKDFDSDQIFEQAICVTFDVLTALAYQVVDSHVIRPTLRLASLSYRSENPVVQQGVEPLLQYVQNVAMGGVSNVLPMMLERRKQIVPKKKLQEFLQSTVKKSVAEDLDNNEAIKALSQYQDLFDKQIKKAEDALRL